MLYLPQYPQTGIRTVMFNTQKMEFPKAKSAGVGVVYASCYTCKQLQKCWNCVVQK